MNSPYPNVRSNATAALRAMGTNGIPSLLKTLQRRDPILKRPFLLLAPKLPIWFRRSFIRVFKPFDATGDRLAAVNALAALGTNAPVPPLLKALHDPERQIAAQAATALGNVGEPAVPSLIGALNDRDGYVRSMACYALSTIGPHASEAAPALIQRFADSYVNIPAQATYALGRIGRPALPALVEALTDENEQVRGGAAKVLGNMGAAAKAAVPALRERLQDNDELVRAAVKEALTNIEQSGAPPTGVK